MKNLTKIYLALIMLMYSSVAWGMEGVPRTDNSGIFVWIFMGVCAVIVTLQLVPALIMIGGWTKGIIEAMSERGMKKYQTKE